MSLFDVFNTAGSALNAETLRLNTTASNLANAESVNGDPSKIYRARHPVFQTMMDNSAANFDQEDAGVLYHRRQPCRQIVDLGIEVDRDPDHDQRRMDRIGRLLHLLQHIGLGFDLVFIGNPLGRAGPIEFCSEEPPVAYGRGQKILHEGGLAVPEPELCSRQRVDRILRQPDGGAGRADGDARPANAEGRSAFEGRIQRIGATPSNLTR